MDITSPELLSRKRNLPRTLSEFIEKFNQENNIYLKVVDLRYFFEKYLEKFSEVKNESEQTLFYQFTSNIPELFDDVSIYRNVENEEYEKKTKLQCYQFIVDAMMQTLKSTSATPDVLLMIQSSLILLYKGYNHCKDCENIYGDLLEQFKDSLASLFNKLQDFQEVLGLKFSKITYLKLHSSQFHLLKPIISDLNRLCELVFGLDSSSGIDLYKILIKLFETYENLGHSDLQIDSILTGLFSEIISIGDEFKLEIKNSEEIPVHESRMFLFKLNVVKKIVKLFPSFIKENLQNIINLILHLYELLISCYHKLPAEKDAKCLKNILVENINPVLSYFYSEKTFLTSVLLLNSKEIASDLQMAHLLLKSSALNFLAASCDQHKLPDRKEVIQNIFLMLQENTPRDDMLLVSLKLPLSLFSQSKRFLALHQSQSEPEPESISLYYHVYLHLSEYCRNISDSDIQNLETFAVDFLLTNSCISTSILVSDIWMYQLRCGTPENLIARCASFSQKISDVPSNSVAKLLLKRMVKFLPLNLKKRLFEQDEQLGAVICDQDKILHRYGAPQLNNNSQINERNISKKISALLDELNTQDFMDNEQLVKKTCCILELAALSVDVLEIQEFLRIMKVATLMFKSEIYEIQIAVLTFLRSLNFKKFNDKDPLFAKVRSSLAVLYNEALKCKNYIVRVEAFSIFYTMAQLTDIRITQETIAKFPDLFPSVKAYVSETPQSGFMEPKDRNELLEKLISNYDKENKQFSNLLDQSKSVLSLLQPS